MHLHHVIKEEHAKIRNGYLADKSNLLNRDMISDCIESLNQKPVMASSSK